MATSSQQSRSFQGLVAGGLALLVVILVIGARYGGLPQLPVLVLFGGLALLAGNFELALSSSNLTISPHVLLMLAAASALNGHGVVVGASVCGAMGGLVVRYLREQEYAVVGFNVVQYGLSGAAAGFVYQALHPSLLVYMLVPLAYLVVNVGLVVPGGAGASGLSPATLWNDMRRAVPLDLALGVLGLLLGRLYAAVSPLAVLAILAPAVAARVVYGLLARATDAQSHVEALYGFTKELEASTDEAGVAGAILTRACELLRVRIAEVTVRTRDGWRRTIVREGRFSQTDTAERPVEVDAMVTGALMSHDLAEASPLRQALEARNLGDAMLAPLRVDNALTGTLTVGNRVGAAPFSEDDLRLLETLANHAAVSLSNAHLLDELRWNSTHDRLTGLYNRDHFNELIAEVPTTCAVLLIDLDRFQEINDTLGHNCGDDLLQAVAARLTSELSPGQRGNPVVARLGGDEFGVLLPDISTGGAAQAAAELLTVLEQPFEVEGLALELTASVGVAVGQGDLQAAKLLQQADVAMYEAKATHSGWEMYSADRDHYNPRRLNLAGELRRAIDRGELEVYYQPKARLGAMATCGIEALVRWHHPRYGLLGPNSFVPVAEHAGLIRPLTTLVLVQAAAEQQGLRQLGFDLGVAVNLSVRSVLDVNLPDHVAALLAEHGMRPSDLTLEITEGSIMADPTRTIAILGRLSDLGVQIALDDFGTGYSSLAYLKRLPATEVKIDRTFTAGMLNNVKDEAIVASTVDLAHHLGLQVVAEGVEDAATWQRLGQLGCDQAQGYFVSPPLTAPALRNWLRHSAYPVDRLP